MTTYIVLAVLLAILVWGAISVLWDWRRSGRVLCFPIPCPYRDRESQEGVWRQCCGEKVGEADQVLAILCEAFGFNPDDRYRFRPDDKVKEIYRACYPRWKVADMMEIESLMMDIEKRYGVEVEDWLWESPLVEIVERVAEKKLNGEDGHPAT